MIMVDNFGRKINYLRISVTDRCNLRCIYCMPPEGVNLIDHGKILTYDQIADFTRVAVSKGIDKVRITGGEPLVRKNIATLVKMLSSIQGIKDLSMTTNGILLEEFAHTLKESGLMRVNVSLDTMDPAKYKEVTRGGDLFAVLRGLAAAKAAELSPVKINCVVEQNRHEADAVDVAGFTDKMGYQVRFIPKMDLESGSFGVVDGGNGGDCAACNRLRLTPSGMLKPCLFNDMELDILSLGYATAIEAAIAAKPSKGKCNHTGNFYNIGG